MDYVTSGLEWFVQKGRFMFYLVTPDETSYPDFKLVPRLVVEVSFLRSSCILLIGAPLDVSLLRANVRVGKCCPFSRWKKTFPHQWHRCFHFSRNIPGLFKVSNFSRKTFSYQISEILWPTYHCDLFFKVVFLIGMMKILMLNPSVFFLVIPLFWSESRNQDWIAIIFLFQDSRAEYRNYHVLLLLW